MVQTKKCFVTKAALRKGGCVCTVRLSKSTRNLHTERVFTLVIHSKKISLFPNNCIRRGLSTKAKGYDG